MNITTPLKHELAKKRFQKKLFIFCLIILTSLFAQGFVVNKFVIENQVAAVIAIDPIEARITKYGWTGNKMANGEYPHKGAVAVSDRSIPLGTRVNINGMWYEVKDRTAKWVHDKFGLTFDIYSEDGEDEMLEWGAPKLEVIIKN